MQAQPNDVSDVLARNGRERLRGQIEANIVPIGVDRIPRIKFYSPSELRSYVSQKDVELVGDCHVMRGETFVIGGEPGVGKSRASTALAVAGATPGSTWFGLTVH